eukprot:jgi/Chlat1/6795/Chrsp51S09101
MGSEEQYATLMGYVLAEAVTSPPSDARPTEKDVRCFAALLQAHPITQTESRALIKAFFTAHNEEQRSMAAEKAEMRSITSTITSATSTGALADAEIEADPVVLLSKGGPGCGKGTQCERMVAEFKFKHLSAGDLLRAEVASGTATGKMCEALMKEGKLVPMDVTISLLKKAMEHSGQSRFLVDGFPRALDQAVAFEQTVRVSVVLPFNNKVFMLTIALQQVGPASLVLFFDCPLLTMEARLLKRGETSGRADDNAATIKKRFDTFMNESLPVVSYYESKGLVCKKAVSGLRKQAVREVITGLRQQAKSNSPRSREVDLTVTGTAVKSKAATPAVKAPAARKPKGVARTPEEKAQRAAKKAEVTAKRAVKAEKKQAVAAKRAEKAQKKVEKAKKKQEKAEKKARGEPVSEDEKEEESEPEEESDHEEPESDEDHEHEDSDDDGEYEQEEEENAQDGKQQMRSAEPVEPVDELFASDHTPGNKTQTEM